MLIQLLQMDLFFKQTIFFCACELWLYLPASLMYKFIIAYLYMYVDAETLRCEIKIIKKNDVFCNWLNIKRWVKCLYENC